MKTTRDIIQILLYKACILLYNCALYGQLVTSQDMCGISYTKETKLMSYHKKLGLHHVQ